MTPPCLAGSAIGCDLWCGVILSKYKSVLGLPGWKGFCYGWLPCMSLVASTNPSLIGRVRTLVYSVICMDAGVGCGMTRIDNRY